MASKGPRSKLDHETRAKRQKALEAPKELPRPKTHWDHVLEEMVWLSKDFESERKWKLVQAKKVAIRASKNKFDQASRGEKKVKEEEQRLRKVALNISKEVKKFWIKIEKLVLYKHQLEFEEKKKKALDKQLDFLLGQTERYSTMLAENLVDMPHPRKSTCPDSAVEQLCIQDKQSDGTDVLGSPESSDHMDVDDDFGIQSEDELQDDEYTIEEDEALITREERKEELEALQDEMDLPLEELLKRYNSGKVSREGSPLKGEGVAQPIHVGEDGLKGKGNNPSAGQDIDEGSSHPTSLHQGLSNGNIFTVDTDYKIKVETTDIKSQLKAFDGSEKQSLLSEFIDEQEDGDYVTAAEEEKDDETTLLEEEELAKADSDDTLNEIELLKRESEMSVEELLARYKKDLNSEDDADVEPGYLSTSSEDVSSPSEYEELKQQGAPIDDGVVEQAESDEVTQVQDIDKCLEDVQPEVKSQEDKENEDRIADAAAAARSAQPTGNTFLTTKVRTKFPFLLKHPMREYQHIGLDWLVTMYEKRLNGILADEMGLGKTIMTISLLAHLACEKGIWGPHLIVVPTSVMLNWETEFLKWCPAFKILTYFGSAKERKLKRQGWLKPNSFHICITTYRLVIQDSKAFKRKKWKYLILDEAHLIKNWKSQRWQTLLNFNSKRRILLTGTPLQNDLMELWSLMHFLMPHIFQSHQEFKDWFCNPISGMVEGQEKVNKEVVDRLHNVLRPFILRRLKRDVEKQLPTKYEHVIYCRLSKRQRNLYEDFIASSETQATLASSNFFGMISVIMQLRKVCNHPDLFESRPIISSFDMIGFDMQLSSFICTMLSSGSFSTVDLNGFGFLFTHFDFNMFSWESEELEAIITPSNLIMESANLKCPEKLELRLRNDRSKKVHGNDIFEEIQKALLEERLKQAKERAASIAWWNSLQCRKKPVYGTNLRDLVTVRHPVFDIHQQKNKPSCYLDFSSKLAEIILSPVERFQRMIDLIESFMFAIPAARAPSPVCWCSKVGAPVLLHPAYTNKCTEVIAPLLSPIRPAIVRRQVYFPDRRLIQFDCGKLQELAVLLRRLKSEGHRALIFTQMTKMLDILEAFISLYGYTYMRLDGSTQPEERQTLMQRFNTNPKIFLFILSTRSGGVGINLVGADTVIFYDSDWNPAMDQQAQDRCHRIGQTREVHIYRLISESTIEENILKKANQKRALDDLVIQSGAYNTEFFKKLDPMELFSGHKELPVKNAPREKNSDYDLEGLLSNADVEAALKQAEDEADYMALKKVEQEEAVDNQEFTDEAILRLEDDEFANEDDLKFDEKTPGDQNGPSEKDVGATSDRNYQNEEKALVLACKEDDTDMLADVKQMAAAAAAAGQASSAFENQLRPIDRYAMQFLNLWDPKVDKSSMESQIDFEETEWELDRIEKFKEDLEAEIDDEEEPLVYERWDADFATEAYRQQVEVLAQRQLMEELEEAKEAEDEIAEAARNEMLTERKPKPKKKKKKTKFKSLKKGALATEAETMHSELPTDSMSIDDEIEGSEHFDFVQLHSPMHKKRKKCQKLPELEEEKIIKKNPKKLKRSAPESSYVGLDVILDKQNTETKKSKAGETLLLDLDHKPVSRSKMGGKISIAVMPVKRVLVVKPEKKKKGNIWTTGSNTSPDSWLSQEDAILCAIIHEYGTNWSLVSEILYGMTAGGLYRGRFRHPVHCCERFRELFQKYVLSSTETPNSEKATNTGSGKAIFKITEDSIQTLLDVARDLPNSDLLLQKHFTAIISSVWRARSRLGRGKSFLSSFQIKFDPGRRFSNSSPFQTSRKSIRNPHENLSFAFSRQSSKFVAAALHDADRMGKDVSMVSSRQRGEDSVEGERLDVTLEALNVKDLEFTLPSVINLSIHGPVSSHSLDESRKSTQLLESSCKAAENRFRVASRACFDGESAGWATSAFSTGDSFRLRPTPKHQSLGKHKAPMSDPPVKSSKLKLQKTAAEPSEPHPISRITFPSTKPVGLGYADSAASVDVLQPFIYHSPGDDEDSGYSLFNLDDRFESDIESLSAFPDHYNPTITSGLEDCILFSDFSDIGWS